MLLRNLLKRNAFCFNVLHFNNIVKTHPVLRVVFFSESFIRRARRVFVHWFFKRRGIYLKHMPLHAFFTGLTYFCKLSQTNKCPRLHERNIIVPVDKIRPSYCIFCFCVFVTLLQLIGNYVFSDAINIITPSTTRKTLWHLAYLGETHIMFPWRSLVYNIVCII